MPTAKKTSPQTRTLLVNEGTANAFKITIPEEWKVTYGRLYGVDKNSRDYTNPGMALRIYEAENKQRACFTGVTGFRDLSCL